MYYSQIFFLKKKGRRLEDRLQQMKNEFKRNVWDKRSSSEQRNQQNLYVSLHRQLLFSKIVVLL